MFYKKHETKNLPMDTARVSTSCMGRFTYNAAGDWRWMTSEEIATFEAGQAVQADQTFEAGQAEVEVGTEVGLDSDHARHDDDGHGAAIGSGYAKPEDDLGTDWGKSSLEKVYQEAKDSHQNIHRIINGKAALAEFDHVIDTAKKMLAESAADPLGTRFALIQYRVEGTDPETLKGGRITGTMALHTIGDQAIIDYAVMLLEERLSNPNSLEIN